MKRFILPSTLALIALSTQACPIFPSSASSLDGRKAEKDSRKAVNSCHARRTRSFGSVKRAAETAVWRPTEYTQYRPWGDGKWDKEAEGHYTYNNAGLMLEDRGTYFEEYFQVVAHYKYTATYTGDPVEKTTLLSEWGSTEDNLIPEFRLEQSYDPRIPSLIVSRMFYTYSEEEQEWVLNDVSEYRTVERDAKGNITAIRHYEYGSFGVQEVDKIEISYDEKGLPSTIAEYAPVYDEEKGENVWTEIASFRDCVWYETEGQIWDLDYSAFEGTNRLKSCTVYDEGGWLYELQAFYTDKEDSYTLRGDFSDGAYAMCERYLYPNDGFRTNLRYYLVPEDSKPFYQHLEEERWDDMGNLMLGCTVTAYHGAPYVDYWEAAEYSYDENGNVSEYILRDFSQAPGELPTDQDPDMWGEEDWGDDAQAAGWAYAPREEGEFPEPPAEGEWEDMSRITYSSYVNCAGSGVETAVADSADEESYWSIDGRRLSAKPEKGMVIVRKGNRAEKLILR